MLFKFLILVHVCAAFQFKCPEPAQWSLRGRGHCPDATKYFCLKNDLINGYSENCTVFDFLQPGRKNVLRGGLDADICSSERYQPWPIKFYTNVSTNCIFLKSTCNDEGQVCYVSGDRNTDTTCRCDYRRGYAFLVKPRKLCFCVPSEEDCSCYLKTCQDSRYVLSQDYECIDSKKNISTHQCKPIIHWRINSEINQSDTAYTVRGRNISTPEYRTAVAIFVTSCLPAFIFLSFPFAVVIIIVKRATRYCYIEQNYFHDPLTIDPKQPIEGDDVIISCEITRIDVKANWYKNDSLLLSSDKPIKIERERKHILKIPKADPIDSGDYCIEVEGVKRKILLTVEDYFHDPLTIDPKQPIEGDDVIISCEITRIDVTANWYKNDSLLLSSDKPIKIERERKHILKIPKAEQIDSGDYCIEVEGVKRKILLNVEENKCLRACHNCTHISMYLCQGCSIVLCRNCSKTHNEENNDAIHSIQLISYSFTQFSLEDEVSLIRDIKCLPNGLLVVSTDARDNKLLVCSISGEERHFIVLNGNPNAIAVMDTTTVAVSLMTYCTYNLFVDIVDIQQRHVIKNIHSNSVERDHSSTFMYIENQLYVVGESHIVVMDMHGTITRRIKLWFTPTDMCYDVDSQNIYCVDRGNSELICIDKYGNSIFTYLNIEYPDRLVIDDEKNMLVLCRKRDYNLSKCIIKVDSNGKSSEVVIANKNKSLLSCICFHRLTKSVVTGVSNTINIYKQNAKM